MHHCRHYSNYRASGLTLVEILVVIVVIGILVSVATLSLGAVGQREFHSEADRLRQVLQYCADKALFEQKTLGLFLQQDSYHVRQLKANGDWQATEIPLFKQRLLTKKVSLSVSVPVVATTSYIEKSAPESPGEGADKQVVVPVLAFYSSGEYTPFRLLLEQPEHTSWLLTGDGLGKVTLELSNAN